MNEEHKNVAEELRRVRDEVRHRAGLQDDGGTTLPPARPVRLPHSAPKQALPEPGPPPETPDPAGVNEAWRAEPVPPRGWRGVLFRALDRLLSPRFEAQQAFNARQVQLDNAILKHIEERGTNTHRHYDRVLGLYGRHLGEIDERHMILQEELVAHVEDLVRRIDLVLSEGERGRLSLDHELGDLRRGLEALQDALKRGA
jgi:hypothetical protein